MVPPHDVPIESRSADMTRTSPTKPSQRDELRGAYRAQSIRAIQDVDGDVDAFLDEVETKRRQLDEQIHRYVKQKEREFKLFERDCRVKYRSAGAARSSSPRASSVSSSSSLASMVTSPPPAGKTSQTLATPDVASVARPRNPRDRETDFLGVFTPSFLPLLNNNNNKKELERPAVATDVPEPSASAPAATSPIATFARPGDQELHRANSDPADDAQAKHVRIKLEKRHSSSGSESRSLVSALKTSGGHHKDPKRKRVSLVVGDEVVKPSDSIAAYESANELARDLGYMDSLADDGEHETEPADDTQPHEGEHHRHVPAHDDLFAGGPPPRSKSAISFALAHSRHGTHAPPSPIKIEHVPTKPVGEDMFGFDDFAGQEDGDMHIENIDDEADKIEVSPTSSPSPAENIPRTLPPGSFTQAEPIRRPSLTSGSFTVPERPVSQIRTLSSSSSQPISPGFSKPSVTSEPMLMYNKDLASPEIEDNMDYGSAKHSFFDRTGSLGESFMERNAQQLRMSGRRRSTTEREA